MTPLELQLEGFTVYRQHTKVDFASSDTALFAVTGPTGAGKSTLLDAITYVLYGKTARLGGRGLGGLISPGSEALFAQLTFRTARGVYRATRVAQRKAGGVGTEVRVEVADEHATGGWRQLAESERVKDANQSLEQIVGLDYDGFTRAVVLPQGAFDQFLRGDAVLRRQLLVSLLGLDKVESIQRLASTKAAQLKGEAEARRTLLATEYGQVGPEAIKESEQELTRLEAFVAAEAAAVDAQATRLAEWRQTGELLEERSALARRRGGLQEAAEGVAGLRLRVERANRAATVAPHLRQFKQTDKRLKDAKAATLKRAAEVRTADEQVRRLSAQSEEAKSEGERTMAGLTAEVAALQQILPLESVLRERGGTLAAAASAASPELLDVQAWNALVAATPLVTPFERAVAAQGKAVQELSRLSDRLVGLEKAVTDGTAELEARVAAGKRLREAEEAAQAQLERARRADLAAAVREGLAPGDPCPVCGGVVGDHEHEAMAGSADLRTATDALQAATAELEQARGSYELARTALTRNEADLENARERSASAQDALAAARAAVESAARDLAAYGIHPPPCAAVAAASDAFPDGPEPTYAPDVGRLIRTELEARRSAALAAHAAALVQRLRAAGVEPQQDASLERSLKQRQLRLQAEQAKLQDLEKQEAEAATQLQLARTRLDAASENQQMFATDHQQAEEALDLALRSAGFQHAADAEGAALPPQELQGLEAQVAAHEQELQQLDRREVQIRAALQEREPLPDAPAAPELQATHAATLVQQAEAELKERRATLDEQQQLLGAQRGKLEQAKERLQRSLELRRELTELDERHALHHQLNTDLHGNRFPEHLLTQVQQVLARRASSILQLVTDGRYDLRLEAGDYLVSDAWAGGELRSARTLSGGESFVASLALALALSDTLAGSAALGALFLDEGFGTLDRATLEAVTGVLESLTTEGRMVGVITHVPELSARLPARLVVTKGPGGSTVMWDT